MTTYLVFKKLGESWLSSKFSEKLEVFRHLKATEIERLRAEIDGSLRARIRHQEKEFAVLSESWDLMNVAYGLARSFVSPFQQYEDINRMPADMREEFLDQLDLLVSQKRQILESDDPTEEFINVSNLLKSNSASRALQDFNNYVYRNEIFIDEEISEDFKSVIKSLRSAVNGKEQSAALEDRKLGADAWTELQDTSHPMILSIAVKLRSRIGSYRL